MNFHVNKSNAYINYQLYSNSLCWLSMLYIDCGCPCYTLIVGVQVIHWLWVSLLYINCGCPTYTLIVGVHVIHWVSLLYIDCGCPTYTLIVGLLLPASEEHTLPFLTLDSILVPSFYVGILPLQLFILPSKDLSISAIVMSCLVQSQYTMHRGLSSEPVGQLLSVTCWGW